MRRACGMTSSCGKQALSRACVEAWSTSGQVFAKAIGIRRHGGVRLDRGHLVVPRRLIDMAYENSGLDSLDRKAIAVLHSRGCRRVVKGGEERERALVRPGRENGGERGRRPGVSVGKSGIDALGGDADLVYASDR